MAMPKAMPIAIIEDARKQASILLHSLLASERGNGLLPIRWTRQAASFVNDLAGRPIRSAEEIARKEQELRELEASQKAAATGAKEKARREAAPVVVYVTDQDPRTRKKVEEVLKGRDIPYVVNDVTDDESTRSWALTQARKTEFPLVFVAGEPVGDLHDLTQLDVTGGLVKRVFG
jgi:glutaredoxin